MYISRHYCRNFNQRVFCWPLKCFILFTGWLSATSTCVSMLVSPLVVAICRRKSTRVTAVIGGLVTALGCLFSSFASQFHQLFFSYGAIIGKLVTIRWPGAGAIKILQHTFFKKNGPTPASFSLFSSFQTQILQKNCRLQQDSNSDCWSRRRALWPLDHHHGPIYAMEIFKHSDWLIIWADNQSAWNNSIAYILCCKILQDWAR